MAAAMTSTGDRGRILLVDDVELNRVLTEAVLSAAAYDVDCAADGATAVRAVEAKDYSLVLMDLDMPGVDGFEAATRIRESNGRAPRIVALTSRNSAAERARSRDVGMVCYLARPIAPNDLVAAVNSLVAPAPPAAVVFRKDIQDEIIARLGPTRTLGFLASLLTHCEDAQRAVAIDDEDLDRVAHDLASTSGMLGFEEVSHCCRDLLTASDATCRADLLAPLARSLTRAVAVLHDQLGHDRPNQIDTAA